VTFGGLWLRDQVGLGTGRPALHDEDREEVSVFDVVLDRDNRAFVDIFFDRPLGEDQRGEILGRPPATLEPPLAGVWRWRDDQILRFEPSGGFPMASEYRLALIPERLLGEGQTFAGDTELTLTTDRFLLEEVLVEEEPAPSSESAVVLRGRLQFNYPVDPRQLAPLIRLVDPLAADDEPVEVELEDIYWTREVIPFRTGEVRKTRDERTLELVVAGELTPAAGNAPLGDDAVHEILLGSRERLVVRHVRSTPGLGDSSVRIVFSSSVAPQLAKKYLAVNPPVDFRISAQRNTITLTGSFQPGSRYQLTIDRGLPAEDEAVLLEPYETAVALENLAPSLDFQSQGTFLSSSGYQNVAVETVNVERLRLAIDRAYLDNLFFLFEFGGLMRSDSTYAGAQLRRAFGDRIVEETLEIEAERNTQQTTVLPVGRYVAEDSPGLYRVLVSRPGQWQAAQRWILLTDLGAVAKRSGSEVLVWVSSVTKLKPVTGARVTLVSDQNQVIAAGRTDAEGLWRFRDREALDEHRPYLLTIEKNDDFTFLAFNRMGIDTAGLEVGGAPPLEEGYAAFLYGERDIYRPGETVAGLAVVRDGSLRPAPVMPALLRHRDPRGNEVETQTAQIDARGLSPFELELPAYALTGSHTLELEVAERIIGRYRFQVEEFIPDRIRVEIASESETVGPGDELAFDVVSHYLFGPPAAGLPVESRVRLVKSLFSAPGFEAYTFHNSQRDFSDREIQSFDGSLDEHGKQSFAVKIPAGLEVPSG
ncbi:MAG: MG2 domain-containing protein, partial [Thermoanaerobaculia bacterium]